ncbi:MAG: FtsW/RodA/SpoVE family cell cycle protein [Oscillospiraceae bacterium]|nr:FtsW/RodA/SpoVE family cell cycle protein [Oscillospiraceae bacterium]
MIRTIGKERISLDILRFLFGETGPVLANVSRYIAPLLAVLVVVRCVRSMLRERYEPETWAYLYLPGEIMVPLRHWECIIGRARTSDACVEHPSIDRMHACVIRSAAGEWTVYNLGKSETQVNGRTVQAGGLPIRDADVLTLGDVPARFVDLTEEERASLLQYRHKPGRLVRPSFTLLLITLYQFLLVLQQLVYNEKAGFFCAAAFGLLAVGGWLYFIVLRASGQRGFEVELLALFLTTVGLSVAASYSAEFSSLLKELILIAAGIGLFLFLGLWMRDLKRLQRTRLLALLAALAFLAVNLAIGTVSHGSRNWLEIAGIRFQPSELVKLLYIYAGAATLDRLFVNRNLIFFIGFSAACVGALALMGDFGTGLIFFVTFLVISFMRSGSFATLFLAIAAAALGVFLVLTVKPYVLARFQTWGHVWEDVYNTGYQQVRAMSAAASGGLFGQGAGNGWFLLSGIDAANSDLVFGAVCEELGLITGLCCIGSLVALAMFVVKNAASNRSSYNVIAASGAVSMMLVQLSLNVFGAMDILPFTGVTFPFVSMGGTSLISCWAMMAFIKSSDNRADASFAVKRPDKFSGGAGVEDDGDEPEDEPPQRGRRRRRRTGPRSRAPRK